MVKGPKDAAEYIEHLTDACRTSGELLVDLTVATLDRVKKAIEGYEERGTTLSQETINDLYRTAVGMAAGAVDAFNREAKVYGVAVDNKGVGDPNPETAVLIAANSASRVLDPRLIR